MTISQIGCIILASVLLGGAIYATLEKRSYDAKIVAMNNAIAAKDQTIEIAQGLYEKSTLETKSLKELLNSKNSEVLSLKTELDKKDQQLIAATSMALKWKHDYEALVAATQTTVPGTQPTDPARTKVSFEKDFGPILVSGYTLTGPPEAYVKLHQQRPLRLTLAISQDKTGLWHTYTTSSEENMSVDITLSGVDPYFAERHWYERLSISALVAAGNNGALGGLGVGIDIGKFTISPMIMAHSSNILAPLYGLGFTWRPFQQ